MLIIRLNNLCDVELQHLLLGVFIIRSEDCLIVFHVIDCTPVGEDWLWAQSNQNPSFFFFQIYCIIKVFHACIYFLLKKNVVKKDSIVASITWQLLKGMIMYLRRLEKHAILFVIAYSLFFTGVIFARINCLNTNLFHPWCMIELYVSSLKRKHTGDIHKYKPRSRSKGVARQVLDKL